MIFHVPQVIWVILMTAGMTISLFKHGDPRTGTEDAWTTVIAIVINFGLLYWGGFFG